MAKRKLDNNEQDTATIDNLSIDETVSQLKQASVLNELALGIAKTKDGWGVVQIAYNSETGESDVQEIQLAGTSRDEAIELFKITAVEKGLV